MNEVSAVEFEEGVAEHLNLLDQPRAWLARAKVWKGRVGCGGSPPRVMATPPPARASPRSFNQGTRPELSSVSTRRNAPGRAAIIKARSALASAAAGATT